MKRIYSLALPLLGRALLTATVFCSFVSYSAQAAPHPESKWRPEPTNGDWNLSANWVPSGVPNAENAQAVFNFSTVTDIATTSTTVHSINFQSGASQFTFDGIFTFNAGGVLNSSGVMQTFNGPCTFKNGATAGDLVTYNNSEGKTIYFQKGTSGGSATFVNSGLIRLDGGLHLADFTTAGEGTYYNDGAMRFHKADGGDATIINQGGASFGAEGGGISFAKSGAGFSTIINNGGQVLGGRGAEVSFNRSTADSATIIANGGVGAGSGAKIVFRNNSTGDLARIEVFGNGNLDVSRPDPIDDSVGSIEGDGLVFLGTSSLEVGANDLSTTFAGVISDLGGIKDGTGGSFSKTGAGDLTLTNENTYTGGTTVTSGALLVNNPTGSGTGPGPVTAEAGTFGGDGTSDGSVIIGLGNGAGATFAPGAAMSEIGTFTTESSLLFNADGLFSEEVNSTVATADETVADGVTIGAASRFSLTDLGSGSLPPGTVFVVISNTSAAPIAGTFANLANGSTTTVGANKYQANYQGGDGNDLTLTVVP
ncbi:MAG: autotransporter-associated beta strand repeat-containing protein [Chthoniobacterales bacterium]